MIPTKLLGLVPMTPRYMIQQVCYGKYVKLMQNPLNVLQKHRCISTYVVKWWAIESHTHMLWYENKYNGNMLNYEKKQEQTENFTFKYI